MARTRVTVVVQLIVALTLTLGGTEAHAAKGVAHVFGAGLFGTNSPRGIAVDPGSSDVYVVDGGGHRVLRFNAEGVLQSQLGAGVGGSGGGVFNQPQGVAVDGFDGSVYVSDGTNLRVQKFTSAGLFDRAWGFDVDQPATAPAAFEVCLVAASCKAGVAGAGDGQFGSTFIGHPAVDPSSGSVYVADPGATANRRIQRFSGLGVFQAKLGTQGAGNGEFGASPASPTRIAVDSGGSLYAVDLGNQRVQKCVPGGSTYACATFGPSGPAVTPFAVAVDPIDHHVFVARHATGATSEVWVQELDSDGDVVEIHGVGAGIGAGVSATTMNQNGALALNRATGAIYLTAPHSTPGSRQVFVLDDVAPAAAAIDPVDPAEIEQHGATFRGRINPNGVQTAYRFEYRRAADTEWTRLPASDADIGDGAGDVEVSQVASGLDANTQYVARLVATRQFGNPSTRSDEETFTTDPAPPAVLMSGASGIQATGARLTGRIHAYNLPTTYHFEYGPDASYGARAPAGAGDAGFGGDPVSVVQAIAGLQPATTYHFRLVATNAIGSADGPDGTFTTRSQAPPEPPAGRGYELVSPADDGPYAVAPTFTTSADPAAPSAQRSTPDGDHVVMITTTTLPGMAEDGELNDQLLASRGPGGWHWTVPLGDRSGVSCGYEGMSPFFSTVSDDGKRFVLGLNCPLDKARFGGSDPASGEPLDQTSAGQQTFYTIDVATDSARLISGRFGSEGPLPRTGAGLDEFVGADTGLSRVYFASDAVLLPNEALNVTLGISSKKLYRRDESGTELITKTHDDRGFGIRDVTPMPTTRPNAVSDDGTAITLTVQGTTNPNLNAFMTSGDVNAVHDVYQVRSDEVVWISDPDAVAPADRPVPAPAPSNRVFDGASADGSRVLFSSTQPITADDTDSVGDIYLYDVGAPPGSRVTRVSTQDGSACPGCDDNASSTVAQTHSQAKFVAISDDGGRVFFITGDVLDEGDVDGQQSLYVRDPAGDATTYVAPVGAGVTSATNGADAGTNTTGSLAVNTANFSNRPIKLSSDGTVAAFSLATDVPLPAGRGGVDSDSARDLFVWRQGDGLRRVRQGVAPDDNTATVPGLGCYLAAGNIPNRHRCRGLTADGELVFFETTDSLTTGDVDGGQFDVYAIDTADGSVQLISPAGDTPLPSRYVDNSESGRDVFFLTGETLDPSRDGDAGRVDMYDARAGEVLPPLEEPSACVLDACQPPASLPPDRGPVASGTGATPDNAALGPRARITVRAPSARMRRRAARTGRLAVTVHTTVPGTLLVTARARVRARTGGERMRRVDSLRLHAARPGATVARLRLSAATRRHLRSGRPLRVVVRVTMAGARPRSRAVGLSRPKPASRTRRSSQPATVLRPADGR